MFIQVWDAGHDTNGNPRRAVVLMDGPHAVAARDMGFMTAAQVAREAWGYEAADAEWVKQPVREVRRVVKHLAA